MVNVDTGFYSIAQATGSFPPAFGDSGFVYGAVLFMLLSVSSVAMQVLLEESACLYRSGLPRTSARSIYARKHIFLMAAFIAAVAPDGVQLLAWGEVSPNTIGLISLADRVLDFVAGVVFLKWWWLRNQTAKFFHNKLSNVHVTEHDWMTSQQLRNKLILLSMSMVLALGVAVAK